MKLRAWLCPAILSSSLLLAGCGKKRTAVPADSKPAPVAKTDTPPKAVPAAETPSPDDDMTDEEEPIAPNIDTAVIPADAGDPVEPPPSTPPGGKPGKPAKPVKPKAKK